jgi:diphthine synthase
LNELIFVGLGLNDECGITVRGLEETKSAHTVFMETYTSLMPEFSPKGFEALCKKKIQFISRKDLEEDNGKIILEAARVGKVVFLVPGDPFIATTHITLRIDAQKRGIKTRVVHGVSIMSSIVSLSGLHNYKFGKTVTVPFRENFSETPYNVVTQNKQFGLHTLCLLDLKATVNQYLSINQALEMLLEIEEKRKNGIITFYTAAVGIARAGSDNPTVKADYVNNLIKYNFGEPPFSLIIPGEMHFMEIDALISLGGAPAAFRRLSK